MQNSIVMLTFSVFDQEYLFGQIWFKKSKLSVWAEIRWLEEFEYAEFNGGVQFFCFRPEKSFWNKSGQKNQNY